MMLPALLAHAIRPAPQSSAEAGRVEAFVTAARTGLEPGVVLPPYADPKEGPQYAAFLTGKDLERRGIRVYQYNQTYAYLNVSNGRIELYSDATGSIAHDPDGTLLPRKVTDAQAAALAQRFYAAAGWPGRAEVLSLDDGKGQNDASISVLYGISAGGVRYDEDRWQGLMSIDRETGKLDAFTTPVAISALGLPAPPSSLAPRVSPTSARLVALGFGVEFRGESLAESPHAPLSLRVWLPRLPLTTAFGERTATVGGRVAPAIAANLSAGRGMLVYTGWLLGGSRRAAVRVTVDAITGQVLGAEEAPREGGAGGAGGGAPLGDIAVPADPRPWRASRQGKPWSPAVTSTLARTPGSVPKGTKLALTDGRVAFPATYDPKANLLGVEGKTYRPGPALARLLRRKPKAPRR